MILLCFLVLGGISILKIPMILLPELDFPQVEVFVPYPNAPCREQVSRSITKPSKSAGHVAHLKTMNATSQSDGSYISLERLGPRHRRHPHGDPREGGTGPRRLARRCGPHFVRNFRSSDIPIIEGRISSGRDLRGSYDFLNHKIKTPRANSGVAEVQIGGVTKRQISIDLRMADIQKYRWMWGASSAVWTAPT